MAQPGEAVQPRPVFILCCLGCRKVVGSSAGFQQCDSTFGGGFMPTNELQNLSTVPLTLVHGCLQGVVVCPCGAELAYEYVSTPLELSYLR